MYMYLKDYVEKLENITIAEVNPKHYILLPYFTDAIECFKVKTKKTSNHEYVIKIKKQNKNKLKILLRLLNDHHYLDSNIYNNFVKII